MIRIRVFCLLAVVMMLAISPASAGPLGKTIKAGISYAQITNDNADIGDSDHELGFAAGIGISYDLVPGITLAPELLYVQQGGKYGITITDEGGNITGSGDLIWDLDYLQVPVLARISLPVVGSMLPTVIAGPAFAFNVASDYTIDAPGGEETGELDDVASTDLSLIVGLGLKFGAGPAGVNVDVRYNYGLSDLNDAEGGTNEIKNRGLQVLAGISF